MKNIKYKISTKKSLLFFTFYLLSFTFYLFFTSCTDEKTNKQPTMMEKEEFKKYKKPLEKANKGLLKIDKDRIDAFLKRRNWKMDESGTGLRSMIYEKGEGEKINPGDVVEFNYTVSLLDGSLCYSSDSLGVKSFRVGQGGVEAGLEEGILLLNIGDKARFIILPFMAHSLLGDFDKIPPRSIILYDIEILRKIKY